MKLSLFSTLLLLLHEAPMARVEAQAGLKVTGWVSTFAFDRQTSTVYATNAHGQIFQADFNTKPDLQWSQISGSLGQLSVHNNVIWGVNGFNQVFRKLSTEANFVLMGNYASLKQISADGSRVCGVNILNEIYCANQNLVSGQPTWERVSGSLKQVEVAGDYLFGVNFFDDIFYKQGTGAWVQIPGKLRQVVYDGTNLCGVNAYNHVFCSYNWPASTTQWNYFARDVLYIAMKGQTLVMVLTDYSIIVHSDMSAKTSETLLPEAQPWRQMVAFQTIAFDPKTDLLYGRTSSGGGKRTSISLMSTNDATNPPISGLVQFSVFDNVIWGVNSQNRIFYGNSQQLTAVKNIYSQLKQISTDGKRVCGVNTANEIYCASEGINTLNSDRTLNLDVNPNFIRVAGSLKQVVIRGEFLFGVNTNDDIFFKKWTDSGWTQIPGKLKQIAFDGLNLCGVNAAGDVYCSFDDVFRSLNGFAATVKLVYITRNAAYVDINKGNLVVIFTDSTMYVRENVGQVMKEIHSGRFQLKFSNGRCLDDLQREKAAARLAVTDCQDTPSRTFIYDGINRLLLNPYRSGLCLDDGAGVNSYSERIIHYWQCDSTNVNQQFNYDSFYQTFVRAVDSSFVLMPSALNGNNPVTRSKPTSDSTNRATFITSPRNFNFGTSPNNNVFLMKPLGKNNLCLEFSDSTSRFSLSTCDQNARGQQFYHNPSTKLIHSKNNAALCLDSSITTNDVWQIQLASCNQLSSHQQFVYLPQVRMFQSVKTDVTTKNICLDAVDNIPKLWTCDYKNPNQKIELVAVEQTNSRIASLKPASSSRLLQVSSSNYVANPPFLLRSFNTFSINNLNDDACLMRQGESVVLGLCDPKNINQMFTYNVNSGQLELKNADGNTKSCMERQGDLVKMVPCALPTNVGQAIQYNPSNFRIQTSQTSPTFCLRSQSSTNEVRFNSGCATSLSDQFEIIFLPIQMPLRFRVVRIQQTTKNCLYFDGSYKPCASLPLSVDEEFSYELSKNSFISEKDNAITIISGSSSGLTVSSSGLNQQISKFDYNQNTMEFQKVSLDTTTTTTTGVIDTRRAIYRPWFKVGNDIYEIHSTDLRVFYLTNTRRLRNRPRSYVVPNNFIS